MSWPKEFEQSDWCDELKGRRYRRHQGDIEYEVVGGRADHSYLRHYNFTRYFLVLKRLSEGSSKRPVGSLMLVPEEHWRYGFVEVE